MINHCTPKVIQSESLSAVKFLQQQFLQNMQKTLSNSEKKIKLHIFTTASNYLSLNIYLFLFKWNKITNLKTSVFLNIKCFSKLCISN